MLPDANVDAFAPDTLAPDTMLGEALLDRLAQQAHIPVATYRLQFNAAFTFTHAAQLVPYLHALGISTCYASPCLKARPGSLHGYDIVDHQTLNPELGTLEDYNVFVDALQAHGMHQILDIVPNHMGIAGGDNAWWMDVLEYGPSSVYAAFFDLDWYPLKPELQHKVLLPVLGEHYSTVLERQELRLMYTAGEFLVRYYTHRFPIAPRSVALILRDCLPQLSTALGETHPHTLELQSILTALSYLPPRTEVDPERIAERYRENAIIKRRLDALCAACPALLAVLEDTIASYNGHPGVPESFDRLDALLNEQAYRLSFWQTAADEINYRRFFDINDLAALRMEDPTVFAATHDLILRLLEEGKIAGVRIDHPDGLADPVGYFQRLHQAYILRHCRRLLTTQAEALDDASLLALLQADLIAATAGETHGLGNCPIYMVVEKILSRHERLPLSWPVHGTTGYDFLHQLNGLFVARGQARTWRNLYAAFVQEHVAFHDEVYAAKRLILETALASELHVLGAQLDRLSEMHRRWRDFTRNSLTEALREIIACFPIYRTYISPTTMTLSATDKTAIDTAVAEARRRNPAISAALFDYVYATLRLDMADDTTALAQRAQYLFIQRFQQLTGPVMAKGLEDTAFYRYTPLISLNDVGGAPEEFGSTVAAFHQANLERQQHWPATLLTTMTHDSKWGEDLRARLNALSEIPRTWRTCLARWHRDNRRHMPRVAGQRVPSRQEEYLLYQTLLGAWPFTPLTGTARCAFVARIQHFIRKALREAKVHTSWHNPHLVYEAGVMTFIQTILHETVSAAFLADFGTLQQTIAWHGIWNSLAQLVLKLTAPGVPDIYQGSELWDLRLVDPDNRAPVDYAVRQHMLRTLQEQCQHTARLDLVRDLLHTCTDGRLKLYVLWQLLHYRRTQSALFANGAYLPLSARGIYHEHVCAFARQWGDVTVLVAVPRLLTPLLSDPHTLPCGATVWQDTRLVLPEALGDQGYRHLFTDERLDPVCTNGQRTLALASMWGNFPVAVLARVT
jgi:(1->4)-alpha-D-glucan 1-alpha-D-glucosylmutase